MWYQRTMPLIRLFAILSVICGVTVMSQIVDLDPCPPGTYIDLNYLDGCAPCHVGSYSNTTDSLDCIPCPQGSVQPAQNSTDCVTCGPGYYSSSQEGIECIQCPIGTFVDVFGASVCTQCPSGKYASIPGTSVCSECPQGTISPVPGMPVCIPCGDGFYPSLEHDVCLACPTNTTTNPEISGNCSINCSLIGPDYISSGFGGPCFAASSVINITIQEVVSNTATPATEEASLTALVTIIAVLSVLLVGAILIVTTLCVGGQQQNYQKMRQL